MGAARDRLHDLPGNAVPRLGPKANAVGLAGEAAFARRYGYPVDTRLRVHGDHGHDFLTPLGTVDVKTARHPCHLIYPIFPVGRKPMADVLVLARYHEGTRTA